MRDQMQWNVDQMDPKMNYLYVYKKKIRPKKLFKHHFSVGKYFFLLDQNLGEI